ncbi:3-hydroxybutyryl-CoA dehydrogenase [Streptomyces sp. NRRL F-5650]|jgi:3-hydroxybutyryl-CoA dehydrogenase|uniref:3-hydroxybutyryl-CoA dehydrogenase n=1 Tax=Streptomyces sp. NRRL F-5650 TaxID=1463868 RepID=UPI00068E1058|nr:3-hydroxybutyryl-CoA dehydrogenase [Streptomyces sp. NRRL F-5650]
MSTATDSPATSRRPARPAPETERAQPAARAEIRRVGVVGCGVMGAGLAEVCGRAGRDVLVAASGPEGLARGRARLERSLTTGLRRGKLSEEDRDEALARIRFTTDLAELGDRQLVLEAAPEHEATKLRLFEALDEAVGDPDAILATNTSALSVMRLARATARPGRVLGLHFFNPAPVLGLVEVVSSLLTEDDTRNRAEDFVTGVLGKHAVHVGDRSGFVVNALLVPYLLSAIRMYEAGYADAENIDKAMMLGCSHPMGPLALADLIGLDTVAAIGTALYEEFKEPAHAVPPLLSRMVDGGLLGRKTGRGFHTY